MRRSALLMVAVLLASSQVLGQQSGLTETQTATAQIEVPELVRLLDLKPGATVADVGAGFGAWTLQFARWTGPAGRVYATDLGTAQLAALRDMVQRERLDNVTVLAAAVDGTNLPAGCCDAILVRDAYHHFTRPAEVVRSLAASLKPGGRLAIVDFPPRPNTPVPDGVPADRGGHGVPPAVVEREVGAALTHVRTVTAWSPKSQPADLFLVLFRKP